MKLTSTGRITEFLCPCCKTTPLEVGKIEDRIEVCFCSDCYGFVIDQTSLGVHIAELRSTYSGPEDKPIPINHRELEIQHCCPACGDMMEVHPYYGPGNVVIDSCNQCKLVWFNREELKRIVKAPGLRQMRHSSIAPLPSMVGAIREPQSEIEELAPNSLSEFVLTAWKLFAR